MTHKPKRVRCWMVSWKAAPSGFYGDAGFKIYSTSKRAKAAKCIGDTLTPGYFVPDAPRRKAKARRK